MMILITETLTQDDWVLRMIGSSISSSVFPCDSVFVILCFHLKFFRLSPGLWALFSFCINSRSLSIIYYDVEHSY
jgi:hypothetical protein